MIVMNRLESMMRLNHIAISRLKTDKIIGGNTYTSIMNHLRKGEPIDKITLNTIDRLCTFLNCQPEDIMEFVPDTEDKYNFRIK